MSSTSGSILRWMFARARWIASTLFQPAFSAMRRPCTAMRLDGCRAIAARTPGGRSSSGILLGELARDEVADHPADHETGPEPHALSLVQSEARW